MNIKSDKLITIPTDPLALKRFILYLCSKTLDNAKFNKDEYAFHLDVAWRRNVIVFQEDWKRLQDSFEPLENRQQAVKEFAQVLVNEVHDVVNEPWATKLIKTEYLSHLDKARDSSERAILLLAPRTQDEITLSQIEHDDSEVTLFLDALKAHIKYCDILQALPFILEKTYKTALQNTGINYQPQKTAEMLALCLDTANAHLQKPNSMVSALKLSIKAVMPNLPLDGQVIKSITDEFLPQINKLISRQNTLEAAKAKLHNGGCALLSNMGVNFDSILDILKKNILRPMHEVGVMAGGIQGVVAKTYDLIMANNVADRVSSVATFFTEFDKIVQLASKFESSLLPAWVRSTNLYYQAAKEQGVALKEKAQEGLGVFSRRVISYIPQGVLDYLVYPEKQLLGLKVNAGLAYLDFYTQIKEAKLQNAVLIEHFFNAYAMEVYKGNPDLKLEYKEYNQFVPKLEHENLSDTKLASPQDSELAHLLALHRLKTSELQFSEQLAKGESVDAILQEMNQAFFPKVGNDDYLNKQYLNPARKRIVQLYLQNKYIPVLENILDNEVRSNTHTLKPIYSALKQGGLISVRNLKQLDNINQNVKELVKKLQQPDVPSYIEEVKTPAQIKKEQIMHSVKMLEQPLSLMLQAFDKQLHRCGKFQKLCQQDSLLKNIIDSKIVYIQSMQTMMNKLIQQAKNPAIIATNILNIRENIVDEYKKLTVHNLMRFAWNVAPATEGNDNLLEKLISYSLLGSDVGNMLEAEKNFLVALNAHPIPALMDILGHPLKFENILPKAEELADEMLNQVLNWCYSNVKDIALEAFAGYFPSRALLNMAYDAINTTPIYNQINAMVKEYSGNTSEQAKDAIKNRLYPLLGVTIKQSLEEATFKYACDPEKNKTDRDTYAMYYLQYRALQDSNPNQDPSLYLKFLFPNFLNEQKIAVIGAKFKAFDKELLGLTESLIIPDTEPKTNDMLLFLVQQVDFQKTEHHDFIRLVLINKMILDKYNQSSAFQEEQAQKLQNEAINALGALLQKIESCAENKKTFLSHKGETPKDEVIASQTNTMAAMMQILAPSVELIDKKTTEKWNDEVENIKALLHKNITWREDMIKAEQCGNTDAYNSLQTKQGNVLALLWTFIVKSVELISLAFSLSSIVLGVLTVLSSTLPQTFGFIFAGSLATMTIPGAILIAGLTVIRFGYKFVLEIFDHREEFKELGNDTYNIFEKIAYGSLLVLKCTGSALLRTFLGDYITKLTTAFFSTTTWFSNIWNAFLIYPEKEVVEKENAHLKALLTQLDKCENTLETLQLAITEIEKDFKNTENDVSDIRNRKPLYIAKNKDLSKALQDLRSASEALQIGMGSKQHIFKERMSPAADFVDHKPDLTISFRHVEPVNSNPSDLSTTTVRMEQVPQYAEYLKVGFFCTLQKAQDYMWPEKIKNQLDTSLNKRSFILTSSNLNGPHQPSNQSLKSSCIKLGSELDNEKEGGALYQSSFNSFVLISNTQVG